MTNQAEWTFLAYLAGDNNLSAAGDKDLTEMRAVGSSEQVNILVQFDNAGNLGTNRYNIQRDGQGERVESLGETDSGDPQVLLDYITWAATEYPAKRYALVLWNHGGGWEPTEMDRIARSAGGGDYNLREATERSASPLKRAFFRTSLEAIFSLPSPSERAICSDDGSGHSLDTVELGRVLAETTRLLGKPVDLLGMDACLMSNFEVAYQASPYARYLVASEESEPNDGWPYTPILGSLVATPDAETSALASNIVQAYIRSYLDRGYTGAVTQSALALARIEALANPLDDLASALIRNLPGAASEVWNAQRTSARFWHNTLWDLAHFCEELEKTASADEVRSASQAVREALAPAPGNFVLAEAHNGPTVARCGGVSIYLPALTDISRYYAELEFAKDSRWLEMLQAYHQF